MRNAIADLREVVNKLVPMLTGKGLSVTQRGSEAYVEVDPRTKKPVRVNIPNISDNASDDFVRAIQGFIDHEVSHVLLTDWNCYGGDPAPTQDQLSDPKVRRFMNLHNITEDTMIEREIVNIFPGSKRNIADMRRHFIEKITKPALASASSDKERFNYLLVPSMRALAGHIEFEDFMDEGGYWQEPMIDEMVKAFDPETLKLLKTCSSTRETLEIAKELEGILYPNKEDDQDEQQDGQSQDKPNKEAESGDGDGERDHQKQDEQDEEDDADERGGDAEKGDEEKESDKEDSADGDDGDADDDADDGDEDGAGGSDGDEEESDESDEDDDGADDGSGDDDDEGDEGEDRGGSDDDGDEPGDSDQLGSGGSANDTGDDDGGSGDADGDQDSKSGSTPDDLNNAEGDDGKQSNIEGDNDEDHQGGGGGYGDGQTRSMFDFEDDAFDDVNLEKAISREISDMAVETMNQAEWVAYTTEFDQVKHLELPANMDSRFGKWVPEMEEETRQMVGRMQKDIERLMASQSHVVNTPGHKSGRMHSPSLYRVTQGDPRVFTRRHEHRSKDTCVTLMIDNSGSMSGAKMHTAMMAGYALSATLDRVKIAHEVIGFTTGGYGHVPPSILNAMQDEIARSGVEYDRITPIVMPIYKAYQDRVDATMKKRMAYAMNAQPNLGANIDGESLLIAADRMRHRTEKRKVMIVLSDGNPVGGRRAKPHLKSVVKMLNENGVETIGIGIMDSSVRSYYDKCSVLNDIDELPGQVMGEIKRILS